MLHVNGIGEIEFDNFQSFLLFDVSPNPKGLTPSTLG